ncbi:flagellar hook-associated protein 2 [Vreelandella aquamarina]|uniref:Flagellar hook-associated protein 2 n=1 Tax=Vreelandella aquamarina TaxID=77097 RepID=A0A1N6CXN5_9GAMM|nr:flagellar filament capping protein FliD [Halomonas meridiana]GED47104.1 flagellar hook-associated protein 2 [Halomonas meridiana]SIN63300.1 flagellar hook-associated protein 2 [Halomonas meridiana]SIN71230.1 flagellar hook-associated protein 2 [Halomonas meridiana]SIO43713.1 flagellar hook-associated protein 2 [Halomonas meridiana]
MATITSLGVGSGLDLTGLLDQLQEAERGKLAPITRQKEQQQDKISAYGQLQTSLNSFQDAVAKLNDPKLYQSLSANVRGDAIKATTSASALPGSYRVEVSQLATSGTLASTRVTDRDTALDLQGATALRLEFGGADAVDIDIAPGSSLSAIRDAINANKDAGVNATIINDGQGYRLALSSKNTGADASIASFSFVDTSQSPEVTVAGPFAEDAATKRAGEDAALTVNGIAISSANNQIEGAIQGVTLNLAELSIADGETTTSTVNVERDTLKQREAINGFVKAFNDLKGTIGKLTSFSGDAETAGELVGDNTVRTIEGRLRSVLTGGIEGGELSTLSQLGITLQRDGKLEVDDAKLSDLVANNPQALSDFFAGDTTANGMAGKLNTTVEQMLGNNGVVKLAISGAENRVKSLDERFERMEVTIERTISRYRTQFGQLDAMIAQMNSMSSYLTQQFDALDAQLGRKR